MDFDKYTAYIASKADMSGTNVSARSMTTMELMTDINSHKQGELLWRIGLPFMAILLILLGIPLGFVNPASGALVQPDYCCPAVYDVQQSIEFHAGLRRSEKDNVRPGMVAYI